ncbi:MAG TPA: hypothetical protein VHX66_15630 [Solirubrobacteraceae bacterium]|jgi:hypothetical protein|nr:hypothetical protein [Solirubrobacteraceae bacterium]
MAYLKPPTVTSKIFNPLAMRFGIGGSVTLAVKRRSSGTTQLVPVVPVEHAGTRYVVSARGEAQWVKNARSAGSLELREKGRSQHYSAVEVPVSERPPIIDAYRAKAGRTVDTYWKRLPDAADHPVFRLEV